MISVETELRIASHKAKVGFSSESSLLHTFDPRSLLRDTPPMPLPTYITTCTENKCIAHDVYEIRFTKPEGFNFKAGQYIMFQCPLVSDSSDCQARAYSIASAPEEAELLFVIKLVENGRMSCFIEQKLTEGTEIEMLGPLGIFSLKDEDTRDLLFVCTATGNAPFRSILKSALGAGDTRKMDLIFGVRHEE